MEFFKIRFLLSCIWFAVMSYICFGYGTGENFKAAPLYIGISLFILCNYCVHLNEVLKPFKVLIVLYIITSVGFWLNADMSVNKCLQYICYSLTGCVTAITSYCLVKNHPEILKSFAYLMLLFFIVGIFRFFKEQSLLESFYAVTSFYFLLFSLPLLLLCTDKKYFHIALLSITILFCILSLKRSAAIASIVLLIMYMRIVAKSGLKPIAYVVLLLVVALLIINHYIANSDFGEYIMRLSDRLENLDEDKGSGRGDVIAQFFKSDIYDFMRIPDFFIGRGFEAYHRKYSDLLAAHNDFIEIFFSAGIIGLICLCRFFTLIVKKSISLIKDNSNIAMSYTSVVFLFIFYAFASSNFYFYNLSLPLFLSIGALEGKLSSNKKTVS